jgi:hypothetical protein
VICGSVASLSIPFLQLLHSPTDFSVAAERLCSRLKQSRAGLEGGEHICFLGSGREQEDQYVTMVVAKFLQKSTPYVSLARGGFLGAWRGEGGREGGRDFPSCGPEANVRATQHRGLQVS